MLCHLQLLPRTRTATRLRWKSFRTFAKHSSRQPYVCLSSMSLVTVALVTIGKVQRQPNVCYICLASIASCWCACASISATVSFLLFCVCFNQRNCELSVGVRLLRSAQLSFLFVCVCRKKQQCGTQQSHYIQKKPRQTPILTYCGYTML